MNFFIQISKYNLNLFLSKVNDINKLLHKNELKDIEYKIAKENDILKINISCEQDFLSKKQFKYIGNVKWKNNVKYCSSTSEEQQVFTLINEINEKHICSCCNTNRKRKAYYVFKDVNNNVVYIGSSCSKQYFGIDIENYLNCCDIIKNDICDNDSLKTHNGYMLEHVLAAAYIATERWQKYVSKKYSDKTTTLQVLNILNNEHELKNAIYEFASKFDYKNEVEKIKLLQKKSECDYDFNVQNQLFDCDGCLNTVIMNPNFIIYELYKSYKKAPVWKEEYYANIGDNIEITLNVISAKTINGFYGTTVLYTFSSNENHCFKAFINNKKLLDKLSENETHNVVCKIKKHESYNGIKQTQISNIKVKE